MRRNHDAKSYIEDRIAIEDRGHDTPCWIWQRGLTVKGYPRGTVPGASSQRAHRAAYEAFVGPIPEGMVTDHLCRVRSCCNPKHLELVTNRENIIRGLAACGFKRPRPPRANKPTHCSRGHEFTPENTHTVANRRRCRACRGDYARSYYDRNRDALNRYMREWGKKKRAAARFSDEMERKGRHPETGGARAASGNGLNTQQVRDAFDCPRPQGGS